jgi:hypothetical protein
MFYTRLTQWLLAASLFVTLASGQESQKGGHGLPSGVLKAMAGDAKDYCDQWVGSYRKGCRSKFQQNLLWRRLIITPSGLEAILVENHNLGACGSAGCSLSLFTKIGNDKFAQVLGTQGDVGKVTRIRVLNSVTNNRFDLQKTWADQQTTTVYKWNGIRYVPAS